MSKNEFSTEQKTPMHTNLICQKQSHYYGFGDIWIKKIKKRVIFLEITGLFFY